MSNLAQRHHSLRWSLGRVDGLHNAEVFVAGKWRTSHVACRRPRGFKQQELAEIRRMVWMNTGKAGDPGEIVLEDEDGDCW